MSKIIGICGEKQSGKSSSCNFLVGHILKQNNKIKYYKVTDSGDLVVNTVRKDENGNNIESEGILDITRGDFAFQQYATHNIWPHVKVYGFADVLKFIVQELFGLTDDQLYGTNEQKNSLTQIEWNPIMEGIIDYNQLLSGRKLLQLFGTLCRKIDIDCFARNCIKRIAEEQPEYAFISDVRFPNEVKYIQDVGGKVIHLSRSIAKDMHESERSLDQVDQDTYDYTIDNKNITIHEKNKQLLLALDKFGW